MSEYAQVPERSILGKKLLLCGLNEAGKTAIRDVVFGGKGAKEVEGLSATINYVRQIISLEGGKSVTIMDLGGQKIFLDRFITKFSPFVFHNVAALIFVVDIANPARFSSSKHYFKAAIQRLKKYSEGAYVFVLLHKMDLLDKGLANDETLEYLRDLFQQEIDTKITFFETTIYDARVGKALKEILEISILELPTRSGQLPMEKPSALVHDVGISESPSSSIGAPQQADEELKLDSEAARSPPTQIPQKSTIEVDIPEIAKAFAFIEDPAKRRQIGESRVKEAIPVPSQPVIADKITEGHEKIESAPQIVEAGASATEESPPTQEPLIEVQERPERVIEKLSAPSEEIGSIEIDISTLLAKDEIEELLPPLEDSIIPQIAPEDVILPVTAFESHPSLDEEFDVFAAAEEVVKFLEVTKDLFKLSYIAIKMSDGENLVQVGDFEKFDALVSTTFEIFQLQTESDPAQNERFVMRAETIFILIEPTGEGLSMILIGPSISKFTLLSKMPEFKARVTKMINMTFSDML
ncbi:MAG: ADP-ribosylation factor-like protein [Candidatus Heimdallarchaeota archaeon]